MCKWVNPLLLIAFVLDAPPQNQKDIAERGTTWVAK